MANLLENTFCHVNFALSNEMARICRGLDITPREVIGADSVMRLGFPPFYPGPSPRQCVGGHCVPLGPNFFGQEKSESMPRYVVGRLQDPLNDAGTPVPGSAAVRL